MDTDCNIDIILFNSAELAIWINQPLSSVEMGAGSLWWRSWSMNAKCESRVSEVHSSHQVSGRRRTTTEVLRRIEKVRLGDFKLRGELDTAAAPRLLHVNHSCRFLLPHQDMLPNIQPFLIDAHGSDVTQSFLIDLTLFG